MSSFEWWSAVNVECENICRKSMEKLYYETSLDDASRYKYMWSLIHWIAIVLSEMSVRIVRWALLVFVVFELDRVRCTMKIQYWWKPFSGINSWVYFLFFFFSCTYFLQLVSRIDIHLFCIHRFYLSWMVICSWIKISKEIYYRRWKINRNFSRISPVLLRLVRILAEMDLNNNMAITTLMLQERSS